MGWFSIGSGTSRIGLDIGTDHIRAAQFKPAASGLQLVEYAVANCPIGAVVEGEIIDADATTAAIKDLWRQAGFREKNVTIGVSNQKLVVRLIDLPYMNEAELQGAIQFQAQDYVPIPVADAVFDTHIVGDYITPNDEHMMEVLLIAAQRDMITTAVSVVERAGLRPQCVDVTTFAIVRALMGPSVSFLPLTDDLADEVVAVVHISSGITNIAVVEKGIPRFTRISALAGDEFTKAISNTLNVTFDEAEAIKLRVGLPALGGAGEAGTQDERDRMAQDGLEREVNKFIAEIRRSLDYYLTQSTQVRSIRKVLLTGSAANLANLPLYLEKGLQAQVILSDPLGWVQPTGTVRQLVEGDRLGSVAAVGLAAEGLLA
jgi:type IV pilus assembly protein PilM